MIDSKAVCIFCGPTDIDVAFTPEHIIPKNIGGTLFLDGAVCVKCNSKLGSRIDAETLKLPDVLRAFKALDINHDRNGILNRHYNLTGKAEDIVLRFGRAAGNDFSFPEQRLPDGSLITPEGDHLASLQKVVKRDKRLQEAGLSMQEITNGINKLRSLYEHANSGDVIEYPELGLAVRKRSEELSVDVTPRNQANIHPLIAKIAYEMLFLYGGAQLFSEDNSELRQLLLGSIDKIEIQKGIFVMRVEARIKEYRPVHLIRLEFHSHITILRVAFFGHIEYVLTTRPLSNTFLNNLKTRLGTDNLYALVYQQQIDKATKSFWIVTEDKEVKCIAAS